MYNSTRISIETTRQILTNEYMIQDPFLPWYNFFLVSDFFFPPFVLGFMVVANWYHSYLHEYGSECDTHVKPCTFASITSRLII